MNTAIQENIIAEIKAACADHVTSNPEEAKRFFKTSAGSYSEHDAFLGIKVPDLRKIAKKYQHTDLNILEVLLASKYNEERLLALFILIHQYQKNDPDSQKQRYLFYLKNLKFVNNWNLVDTSAHLILGHYLWDKDRLLLNNLATSAVLWERRVAIVATWFFIRKGETKTTYAIATQLLQDKHDLIHKAVGWMLREAGKKDEQGLLRFLSKHAKQMPKTMLRYAMERLTPQQKESITRL